MQNISYVHVALSINCLCGNWHEPLSFSLSTLQRVSKVPTSCVQLASQTDIIFIVTFQHFATDSNSLLQRFYNKSFTYGEIRSEVS